MKCPYCDAEMEQGVIQSPHEISWDKKKRIFGRAEFHEGAIVLSELSILRGSAVIAHCCRKCEKIVINFKDGNCDISRTQST
jgi:hypothetical protein